MQRSQDRPIWRRLPVAWRQLVHQKVRLFTAILGVAFAAVLMFTQLGLKESLMDSVVAVEMLLDGDLFVIDKRSKALLFAQPFSRRLLFLTRSFPEVESAAELMVTTGQLKHPITGTRRAVQVIGIDAMHPALSMPEIERHRSALLGAGTMLYDARNNEAFGPIPELFERNRRLSIKVEQQTLRIAGIFKLGAGFGADGNIILGKQTFQRTFPERSNGAVDVGVLKLKRGASIDAVKAGLSRFLPGSMRVMTREELLAWERDYWGSDTAIGAIFNQGMILGFIVGVVIIYQILFTDVANHLSEYATLKAIGYTNGYLVSLVFQEAVILSVLGYVPGVLVSRVLYHFTEKATAIPMALSVERGLIVFAMTVAMSTISGLLAVRKLRQAAPAEVF